MKKEELKDLKNKYNKLNDDLVKTKQNGDEDMNSILREKEFLTEINRLEKEVVFIIQKIILEDRLHKVLSQEKNKSNEIEIMQKKIREFEAVLDDNANQYIETIKFLKIENEEFKIKFVDYERMIEILNIFFKKLNQNFKIFQ